MGQRRDVGLLNLTSVLLLVVNVLRMRSSCVAEAYQNHTVGESLGWFDNPALNYQKWADSKTFSLADFLIFNTDNNHSIVQTTNYTTYKLCSSDDDLSKDTLLWSVLNPSAVATDLITVAVPLLKEGTTYFFSGDYEGDQCKNGQRFKINVTHGEGLPESMRDPLDESPGPMSAQAGDDESAPDTIVPANFDHPKEDPSNDKDSEASAKVASGSASLVPIVVVDLSSLFVFLGLVTIHPCVVFLS